MVVSNEKINLIAYKLINCLLDLFFVLVRFANHTYGVAFFYERAGRVLLLARDFFFDLKIQSQVTQQFYPFFIVELVIISNRCVDN
ncbi:hypothetical protein GCM10019993_17370 [Enterococcus pseudoavium]